MDFNPKLPKQSKVLAKHHRAMIIKNKSLLQVFPNRPMAGLRQGMNLRRLLCRTRLYPQISERPTRTSRKKPGWNRCSGNTKQCPICPFTAKPTTQVISDFNGYIHTIKDSVNCQSKRVIYRWQCKKVNCKDHPRNSYIGKTTRTFQQRFSQHRDYAKGGILNEPSGEHFNLPGHSVADIEGIVLEKVKSEDPFILKTREHYYIQKYDSFRNVLNKEN